MKLICPKCGTRNNIGSASRYDVFLCRSCGWHFRGLHANHTFGSWLSDPFFAFVTACPHCSSAIRLAKASNRVGVVGPDVCHDCGRDLPTFIVAQPEREPPPPSITAPPGINPSGTGPYRGVVLKKDGSNFDEYLQDVLNKSAEELRNLDKKPVATLSPPSSVPQPQDQPTQTPEPHHQVQPITHTEPPKDKPAPPQATQRIKVFFGPKDPWGAKEPSLEDRRNAVSSDNPKSPFSKIPNGGEALRVFQEIAFEALGREDHLCNDRLVFLLGDDGQAKEALVEAFSKVVGLPLVTLRPEEIHHLDHVLEEIDAVLTPEGIPLVEVLRPKHFVLPACIVYFSELPDHQADVVDAVLIAASAADWTLHTESGKTANCFNVCWVLDDNDESSFQSCAAPHKASVHVPPSPRPEPPPNERDARSAKETDWKELYAEKKYLELTWHPIFMGGAKKESLEGLLAWVRRNEATIDPDDFEIAVARLERVIRKRQAEASHEERN